MLSINESANQVMTLAFETEVGWNNLIENAKRYERKLVMTEASSALLEEGQDNIFKRMGNFLLTQFKKLAAKINEIKSKWMIKLVKGDKLAAKLSKNFKDGKVTVKKDLIEGYSGSIGEVTNIVKNFNAENEKNKESTERKFIHSTGAYKRAIKLKDAKAVEVDASSLKEKSLGIIKLIKNDIKSYNLFLSLIAKSTQRLKKAVNKGDGERKTKKAEITGLKSDLNNISSGVSTVTSLMTQAFIEAIKVLKGGKKNKDNKETKNESYDFDFDLDFDLDDDSLSEDTDFDLDFDLDDDSLSEDTDFDFDLDFDLDDDSLSEDTDFDFDLDFDLDL